MTGQAPTLPAVPAVEVDRCGGCGGWLHDPNAECWWVDLGRCPYYLGTETKLCAFACDDEPQCQTCRPTEGWVSEQPPQRIQLRRVKGWRLPSNTVIVARPSKWGNPFKIGEPYPDGDPRELQRPATAEDVVGLFGDLLAGLLVVPGLRFDPRDLSELRGRHLACWCRVGAACHGDLLLEAANR